MMRKQQQQQQPRTLFQRGPQRGPNTLQILVLLAIMVAIGPAWLLRQWDADENWVMNLLIIVLPRLMDTPVEHYFGKPQSDQLARIQIMRDQMELLVSSERTLRFAMGDVIADASYGPNATRVATFKMPVVGKGSFPDGDDDGGGDRHFVEVTCTCPHDATADDVLPIIFFFHSGGMIAGSVNAELNKARYLAQKVEAVVCSPEYRLAPEHPYPAGLDDCIDSSLALLSNEAQMHLILEALGISGIDTRRVGTFGYSAGGYLSALVARELTAAGHNLALQVSLVPMAQPHGGGTSSMFEHWYAPVWNGPFNMLAWSLYLSEDTDGSLALHHLINLLVDPPDEDTIRRLPPAYVQINTKDVLRDEGERYANRLREQGKLLRLDEYNTNHVGGSGLLAWGGGPGENAFEDAIKVVVHHFHELQS
mmetsp:Transcript_33052/g.97513  ORF Transcript_33052/g.97513 Transcript_33052/m.97513 type:complete len:422 (+) Transcript_33052:183-1448(+)